MDKIGASLTDHYREIVNRDGFVTAEKVKNAYLGMDIRTLMEYSGGGTKRGANRELVRDMFIFCVFTGYSFTAQISSFQVYKNS